MSADTKQNRFGITIIHRKNEKLHSRQGGGKILACVKKLSRFYLRVIFEPLGQFKGEVTKCVGAFEIHAYICTYTISEYVVLINKKHNRVLEAR